MNSQSAGLHTVAALMMTTSKTLTAIKGLTEAKITKMLAAAQKIHDFNFITGTEVAHKRKKMVKMTTGSSDFDKLIGGGIESCAITEAFGEFRCGKTQICHTLSVTAQLPVSMGGVNGKVIWIDTENSFRPSRVIEIAERFGVDGTAVLENIVYARAFTHEHQMNLLQTAAAKMCEESFGLIIIDSATALFRVDFNGRGQLAERQQKLGQFLSTLQKMAEEFNVAVFITNQVVADPGASAMFVADAKKPVGGHVLAHACTTRLQLRKGKGDTRICKVYDSPCLPEGEVTFAIGEGGILNSKE